MYLLQSLLEDYIRTKNWGKFLKGVKKERGRILEWDRRWNVDVWGEVVAGCGWIRDVLNGQDCDER